MTQRSTPSICTASFVPAMKDGLHILINGTPSLAIHPIMQETSGVVLADGIAEIGMTRTLLITLTGLKPNLQTSYGFIRDFNQFNTEVAVSIQGTSTSMLLSRLPSRKRATNSLNLGCLLFANSERIAMISPVSISCSSNSFFIPPAIASGVLST